MNRRRFLYAAGGVATLGLGAGVYGRFIEPTWIEYVRQPLPARRGAATSVSLAQISDLHLKRIGEEHEDIGRHVARAAPDVVVITGDSIDSPEALPLLADFLSLLPHGTPKYAILGNWEHWGGVNVGSLAAVYERANCELLVNRSVELATAHGTMRIGGLDDLVGGRPDVRAVLPATRDADMHVLLAHCPAQRDALPAEAGSIDLVLSGHTHGGQVRILGYAPMLPRGSGRYVEGWYRNSGPALYVSRGVGTSVAPVRLGARPEVTFFESSMDDSRIGSSP